MSKSYLEVNEVARLEKEATNLRDKLLIRLLFRLGCYVSEALASGKRFDRPIVNRILNRERVLAKKRK